MAEKRIRNELDAINSATRDATGGIRVRAFRVPGRKLTCLLAVDFPPVVSVGILSGSPSPLAGKTLPVLVAFPVDYPFKAYRIYGATCAPGPYTVFDTLGHVGWNSPADTIFKSVVQPLTGSMLGTSALASLDRDGGFAKLHSRPPDIYCFIAAQLDGRVFQGSAENVLHPFYHHFCMARDPLPAGTIRLFLKTLSGTTVPLSVDPEDSVSDLKGRIALSEGVPPHAQLLVFAGHELEDGRLLKDYHIQVDSTVHMVLRAQSIGRDCLCDGFQVNSDKLESLLAQPEELRKALGRVAAALPDAHLSMEQIVAFLGVPSEL